jgi:hypothetical protein
VSCDSANKLIVFHKCSYIEKGNSWPVSPPYGQANRGPLVEAAEDMTTADRVRGGGYFTPLLNNLTLIVHSLLRDCYEVY